MANVVPTNVRTLDTFRGEAAYGADADPSALDTLVAPEAPIGLLKVDATGGIALNATTAITDGYFPGQLLTIVAEGGALTIPDGANTSFNSAALILAAQECALLVFDDDQGLWRVVQGASEMRV